MIDTYNDKWDRFENSGQISDYLAYKGVCVKTRSCPKGESRSAYNDPRSSDLFKEHK